MLVDLTYKCSMNCTHCISDCNENGEHMSIETLKDVLFFCEQNNIKGIVYSGGELFENPDILEILDLIAADCIKRNIPFNLTTNGYILSDTPEYMNKLYEIKRKLSKNQFLIQVTNDDRFYPKKLSSKQIYNLKKLGAIIERVPARNIREINKCLYPQGRALSYSEEWYDTIAPKCINCRIIPKQKNGITFSQLNNELLSHSKICTPCIDPKGNIKLGESRLCPVVSNIYKSDKEIMNDIRNCKCQSCSYSIRKLIETNRLGYMLFIS